MSITVNSVNDAPANAGDTAAPSEDVAYSSWTAASDWGYSDVDGDTLVSVTLKSLPSQGTQQMLIPLEAHVKSMM